MYKVFVDSDGDFDLNFCKEFNVEMISMPYVEKGKIIYPYKDFIDYDYQLFYDNLRKGNLTTTCALNVDDYIKYFEPVFKDGNDILYIHFSSAMTATFDYMHKALEQLNKKYPERVFKEIDCKAITIGQYTLTKKICQLLKENKSIDEVVEYAKNDVDHFAMYFFADDLTFFKRSGRVGGLSAFMGNIIGIKPIIYMSPEGKMENIGKEVGRIKAINTILTKVEELQDNMKDYPIVIGHTDSAGLAGILKEKLLEKFGDDLDVEIVPVNPTAGSHCGPDSVGICFHAIHR